MNDDIKLSEHFWLSEAWGTSHRDLLEENRLYCSDRIDTVQDLAKQILEPLRDYFRTPIKVTSWVRCPTLNERVGGSKISQHLDGAAADIQLISPSWGWNEAGKVVAAVKQSMFPWGQAIRERSEKGSVWVHVSLPRGGMRYEALDRIVKIYLPFNILREEPIA